MHQNTLPRQEEGFQQTGVSVELAVYATKEVAMSKGRMEAFSDGVFAVIITIMVLEMKSPQGTGLRALKPLTPVFFSYVLSFIYLGIYWNNHHHLLQAVRYVAGDVLWANLHLLFWLSMIPFATSWVGENPLSPWPVALYGTLLLFAGIAYFILTKVLIAHQGAGSTLAASIGRDRKGAVSIVVYSVAIPLAFTLPWLACACYVVVALMWLIPDRRIEKALSRGTESD
jgi:TMEM175 potassium channel family protein